VMGLADAPVPEVPAASVRSQLVVGHP